MKIKIDQDAHGNPVLKLEAALTDNKPSRSGNSTIVATTRGQQYVGEVKGRPTYVQLNVMQMDAADSTVSVENELSDTFVGKSDGQGQGTGRRPSSRAA